MDDPLSAVDTSVAEHIFDKCIVEYLSNKIRILVTHQIQFIRKATQILVLSPEGRCLGLGSYDELHSQGLDFISILSDAEREAADHKAEPDKQERELLRSFSKNSYDAKQTETLLSESINDRARRYSRSPSVVQIELSDIMGDEEDYTLEPKIQEENREVGSIGGHVYYEYVKAGAGPVLLTITLFTTLVSQGIFLYSDLWLTKFTGKNQKANAIDQDTQNFYVYVYSGLIGALFVTSLLRAITWFVMCMRASVNLHNSIFTRLLRAPIAVFDNNPVGQMLNRFSKDMGIVDEMLPFTVLRKLFETIGIIITVAIVNIYLIIPARSPLFTHVSTTLNGLASVRAYGAQEAFERQYYVYQNDHNATWFLFACTSRALGLILDWVCVGYLVAIAVVMMVFPEQIGNGGSAGLALTSAPNSNKIPPGSALTMTAEIQWGVKQSAEMESQMTSVERIIEYSRLPQEAPLASDDRHRPPPDWPSKGQIELRNVSLVYEGSTKPVLKNLCCSVKSGEKIG
ncbi:unnamed protein product, partial [Oppiella nova]